MSRMRRDLVRFINEAYCAPLNAIHDGYLAEPDEFSGFAIYISAYDEEKIIGSVRFILGPNNQLNSAFSTIAASEPGNKFKGILSQQSSDDKSTPELSRLVVAPNILGEKSVIISLVTELSKLSLEYQHDKVGAILSAPCYHFLCSLDIDFKLIHPHAFEYLGQLHYWVTFQPSQIVLRHFENEQLATTFSQVPEIANIRRCRNQFLMKRLYPEKRRHALESTVWQ